jgi:hypothetical protein
MRHFVIAITISRVSEAQCHRCYELPQWRQLKLVAEFTEVESGKHSDRAQLRAAQAACKKHKETLIIAKLDRLSRNLHFFDWFDGSRYQIHGGRSSERQQAHHRYPRGHCRLFAAALGLRCRGATFCAASRKAQAVRWRVFGSRSRFSRACT